MKSALLAAVLTTASVSTPCSDSLAPERPFLPFELRAFPAISDTALTSPVNHAPEPDTARLRNTLQVRGHRTATVRVGGEGGTSIDQTLQATVEGEAAPGVTLRGRISDQGVPLSAQGAGSSLRELDEIWVEVSSRRGEIRLGDIAHSLPRSRLGTPSAAAQGVLASWGDSGSQSGRATILHGEERLRWRRIVLHGRAGVQEGWSLGGDGLSRVVPASVSVRLDGQELSQGPRGDFVVDAARGTIDFLPSRRLRGGEVIEVEFQESALPWRRTRTMGRWKATAGPYAVDIFGLRRSDDPSVPLTVSPDPTGTPSPSSLLLTGASTSWKGASGSIFAEARLQSGKDDVRDSLTPAFGLWAMSADARLRSRHWETRVGTEQIPAAWRLPDGSRALRPVAEGWNHPALDTSVGRRTQQIGVLADQGSLQGHLRLIHRQASTVNGWLGAFSGSARIRSVWCSTSVDAEHAQTGPRTFRRGRISGVIRDRSGLIRPLVRANWEDRQVPAGGSRARRSSIETRAGFEAGRPGAFLGGEVTGSWRLDRTDGGFDRGRLHDSLQTRGLRADIKAGQGIDRAELLLDGAWRDAPGPLPAGLPSRDWLGRLSAAAATSDGRASLDLRISLARTDWRPLVEVWDTVPAGTGDYTRDNLTGRVVPSLRGDLVLAGWRPDTTATADASLRRELGLSAHRAGSPNGDLAQRIEARLDLTLSEVGNRDDGLLPSPRDRILARAREGMRSLALEVGPEGRLISARLRLEDRLDVRAEGSFSGWDQRRRTAQARLILRPGSWWRIEPSITAGTSSESRLAGASAQAAWRELHTDVRLTLRAKREIALEASALRAREGEGTRQDFDLDRIRPSMRFDLGGPVLTTSCEVAVLRGRSSAPWSLRRGLSVGRTIRPEASLIWAAGENLLVDVRWSGLAEEERRFWHRASAEVRGTFR